MSKGLVKIECWADVYTETQRADFLAEATREFVSFLKMTGGCKLLKPIEISKKDGRCLMLMNDGLVEERRSKDHFSGPSASSVLSKNEGELHRIIRLYQLTPREISEWRQKISARVSDGRLSV